MSVSKLAQKVIDAYSHDLEGLTAEECSSLIENPKQADALCAALGTGSRGRLERGEYQDLKKSGLSDELIKDIFIKDGGALAERIKWFADQPAGKEMICELIDICVEDEGCWDDAAEALCRIFERVDKDMRDSMWGWLREKIDTLENRPTIVQKLLAIFGEREFVSREFRLLSLGDLHIKHYGDKQRLSFVHDKAGVLAGVIPGTVDAWDDGDGIIVKDFNGGHPVVIGAQFTTEELGERIELLWESMDKVPDELFRSLKLFVFSSVFDHRSFARYSTDRIWASWNVSIMDIAHEFAHHWDRRLSFGADSLFNRISWQERSGRTRRICLFDNVCYRNTHHRIREDEEDYDNSDFLHDQAEMHPDEDLAHSAGNYVGWSKGFRQMARYEMDEGNFEYAAKYLFVKHVMPFAGREYDVDERSPALTIEEVKEKYLAAKDTSRTNPGTYDVILDIERAYPLPESR